MTDHFFIRKDEGYERLNFEDIYYIEARDNYVRMITREKFYVVLILLKEVAQAVPASKFCRVSRSYIAALDKVASFDDSTVTLQNGVILTLGTEYKPHFLHAVPILVSASKSPTLYQRYVKSAGHAAAAKQLEKNNETWELVPVRHVQ